jgi:hypothetical protein
MPCGRRALRSRSAWGVAVHTTDELVDPVRFSLVHGARVVKFTLLDQVDRRALLGQDLEGGSEVREARLPAAHQAAMDAQARADGAAGGTNVDTRIAGS